MGMRNYTKTSLSSAGKRRAKVFMADLVLSSGLSTSRTRNSINFLVAYASGVVVSPLSPISLQYRPSFCPCRVFQISRSIGQA